MKKVLLGCILSLLFLSACKTSKQGIDSKQPLENALLWEISGKNMQEPSYLFGTIHLIEKEDYFLPKGMLSAIDHCQKMVFEIDMNEMSDMSNMMALMTKTFMNDNVTLKDLISTEDYALVDKHFQKAGLPLMLLERMKPMFLTAFAYDVNHTDIQSGEVKSYEFELTEIAQNANMTIGGLETIEFQMSVFDSISYKDQAEMLVESIKNADTGSDEFEQMTQLYKAQDINGMITMIGKDDAILKSHEDILLTKRNKNWIPIIAAMVQKKPTFFAVGAGHLAGANGVIRLLQKEGYTLTPILNK